VLGFKGDWRPFSNFWIAEVEWGDAVTPVQIWPSNELPYQIAKTLDPIQRLKGAEVYLKGEEIGKGSAFIKKWGKSNQCTLRPNWKTEDGGESVVVMRALVLDKFRRNPDLKELLLSTEDGYLEETNTWNDTFFGVCRGAGANWLGRILMETRGILGGVGVVEKP